MATPTNITRRRILSTLAIGAAAALPVTIAVPLPAAASIETVASSKVAAAIQRHRKAHAEFENSCNPADEMWCKHNGIKVTKAAQANWRRTGRAENAAFMALCCCPVSTPAEGVLKSKYLRKHHRATMGFEVRHVDAILRSFAG